MIVRYSPTKEFSIDDVSLQFGMHREVVREKLGGGHQEKNKVVSLGDSVEPIVQRRDIYNKLDSTGDFFFLNYDKDDLLRDLEVHDCEKIQVLDFVFDFNNELDVIASELAKFSPITLKKEGEVFFKGLHISIIDKMRMGGEEDTTLGYFYCSADIKHLDE
jgi:hypothetical protein